MSEGKTCNIPNTISYNAKGGCWEFGLEFPNWDKLEVYRTPSSAVRLSMPGGKAENSLSDENNSGKKRSSANDPPNAPQNSLSVSPMNRGSIKRKETHDSFLLAATVHWGNTQGIMRSIGRSIGDKLPPEGPSNDPRPSRESWILMWGSSAQHSEKFVLL